MLATQDSNIILVGGTDENGRLRPQTSPGRNDHPITIYALSRLPGYGRRDAEEYLRNELLCSSSREFSRSYGLQPTAVVTDTSLPGWSSCLLVGPSIGVRRVQIRPSRPRGQHSGNPCQEAPRGARIPATERRSQIGYPRRRVRLRHTISYQRCVQRGTWGTDAVIDSVTDWKMRIGSAAANMPLVDIILDQ